MKIAALSDIHGNLPALEAAIELIDKWQPDITIVNGDIVNRGPRSVDCWQLVQAQMASKDWRITRGNHEDFVTEWQNEDYDLKPARRDLYRSSYWTYQQFGGDVDALKAVPMIVSIDGVDGAGELRATHASMRGNRDGMQPWSKRSAILERIDPAPAIFITSHTHRTFIREIGATTVVNTGSVGAPFDGNPFGSYAQLTCQNGSWDVEVIRFPYDRDRAKRYFLESGFVDHAGGGPFAPLLYREWLDVRSHVPFWGRRYSDAVLAGKISVADAVREYFEGKVL